MLAHWYWETDAGDPLAIRVAFRRVPPNIQSLRDNWPRKTVTRSTTFRHKHHEHTDWARFWSVRSYQERKKGHAPSNTSRFAPVRSEAQVNASRASCSSSRRPLGCRHCLRFNVVVHRRCHKNDWRDQGLHVPSSDPVVWERIDDIELSSV